MADIKNNVISFFQAKGEIPGKTETERLACAYLEVPLIDSMGIIEMIIEFEEQWQIHFSPQHMQSPEFRTIGGIVELIENLTKEQLSSPEGAH